MNHLEDERSASAHLDLPDIKAEAEERFEEGTFSVGLSTEGNDLRDRKLLAECHCGGLQPIICLKPRLRRRRRRVGHVGVLVVLVLSGLGFLRWSFSRRGDEGTGARSGRHRRAERERERI